MRIVHNILMLGLAMTLTACSYGSDLPTPLPAPAVDHTADQATGTQQAVFAGGCFWCTEGVFERLQGVSDVVSGYAGGSKESAHYQAVSAGKTDHAEVIQITYDANAISYGELLRVFFSTHNPTQLNRQGPDRGRQYRTAVFPQNESQQQAATAYIEQLNQAGIFNGPIVTTVETGPFYPAEDYHQDFVRQNPGHPYIIQQALPKIDKLKKLYPEQLAK